MRDLADNLREPLAGVALDELKRGSELTPGVRRPARLYSLASSAALVVNVFAYWHGRDAGPLLRALVPELRFGVTDVPELRFEEPLPTGLPGDPPTVDVALDFASGRRVAIESKYAEWLALRPRRQRAFKDKYFPQGQGIGVWAEARLPRCQALAEDLQSGRERLKHLHSAQLLKHALGLAKSGRASTLIYLYYDWPGREAAAHRSEIERVVARLESEVDLRVATYQSLFAALRTLPELDPAYVDYLARRYFA